MNNINTYKVTRKFSDIDFDFIPHPATGDIIPLNDADAVKRSVRNLMFTALYERVFQPNMGANLRQLLFEPVTPLTAISIETLVKDIIRLYEPRATILELKITLDPDELGYNLQLIFSIDNISEVSFIDMFLERIR
ncbi:COG3628 Phage baseplate assembly protein W [uncultured Caudovirales phage]|uniref:COG3628 Phage baseplate assembly protein W n=1 Tax=uncultured Caudovirales phage TaxID=2100421 RepID=A0A6J5M313_9CAUD|nr:COG3628 Phage baseplate assembly protein W [uncultured Caudovirales phage]